MDTDPAPAPPQERIRALQAASEGAILVLRELVSKLKEQHPAWAERADDAQHKLTDALNDTHGLDC